MARVAVCLLLYGLLASTIWFGLGTLNMTRLKRLAAESASTRGRVAGTDCRNHGTVRYVFEVDGRVVTSAGPSPEDGRSCNELRPGDAVTVWYLPTDPATSSLRDPQDCLANEALSIRAAATVFPAMLVGPLGIALWFTRRKGADHESS